ncbi:hypothetical protein E2320_010695 [Naja naja]|nr:hypothetical protein E2320_010695 [Naja naja]
MLSNSSKKLRGLVLKIYRKTTMMLKLTLEKEELRIKTEMLTFKNLQISDKKEALCRKYEGRLWRENSSDESGQLNKLRRENENLSCNVQKFTGEKAELL